MSSKRKAFHSYFVSLVEKGSLRFTLYLCSLCRFIKGRCFALCLVIPIMRFDFSRCIWNCQPLGFLLLYLDKVGLREVSFFFKKSYQLVLALPFCLEVLSGFFSKYFATVASHLYLHGCKFFHGRTN